MRRAIARKVPSKCEEILEYNLPIRLTWSLDGSFKNMEVEIPKNASRYQRSLVRKLVADISLVYDMLSQWGEELNKRTPVPDYVTKAFEEDDGEPV